MIPVQFEKGIQTGNATVPLNPAFNFNNKASYAPLIKAVSKRLGEK